MYIIFVLPGINNNSVIMICNITVKMSCICITGGEMLIVIDQHAAHERVRLEKMAAGIRELSVEQFFAFSKFNRTKFPLKRDKSSYHSYQNYSKQVEN